MAPVTRRLNQVAARLRSAKFKLGADAERQIIRITSTEARQKYL